MTLLAIDIGTTTVKAARFALDGRLLASAARPNPVRQAPQGYSYYDPGELWAAVCAALAELSASLPEPPLAVGVTGMAETGLLLGYAGGRPHTPLLPWFDRSAAPQAAALAARLDVGERYRLAGIRPSFKPGLMKLLWVQENDPAVLDGAGWLGAPDYIAYHLSGIRRTDWSLASRSYAFRLERKAWDAALLVDLGLPPDVFPPPGPAWEAAGVTAAGLPPELGLPAGLPLAVAGHDHPCAGLAAALLSGGLQAGLVFDSLGTAEALLGLFPERPLTAADFESGFSCGLHVAPGWMYWGGGLSASGGSIEWLRGLLGDPPLSYADLDALLDGQPPGPGELLYYPYLSGRGAPHTDQSARASFLGLSARHGRPDLYRAVLEGTACEIEWMRRRAERTTGAQVTRLLVAGGGARNRRWLQIRADLHGVPVEVLPEPEATLLGAALLAGLAAGLYPGFAAAARQVARPPAARFDPDPARHAAYRELFARWEAGL